ncbi:MAG: hypothetical protein A2X86_16545 [Bdellovibrionales bacterium GWA2_49_15]|nr:MAG: hypothetical protein A2X86_16545 [Bdellovibrionales bacterium GWA2_49_15]HAZ13715.1 hypothetical protein [Bdellovibrionales bacterium]
MSLILLLVLGLLSQGCGVKSESEPLPRLQTENEIVCQQEKGGGGLVTGQIFSLVKKLAVLSDAYHKRYQYPSLKEAGILYPYNVNLSPQQPLRITVNLLAKVLDELTSQIESFKDIDLRSWARSGEVPDFTAGPTLTYNVLYKLRVLVAQIYGLEAMALRFENASCHADELAKNVSKDIASYLILKGLECTAEGRRPGGVPFCLDEVLPSWNSQEYLEVRNKIFPHLLILCGMTGKADQQCRDDVAAAIASGKLMPWYKEYREQVRIKRFKPLFDLRQDSKRYACTKINSGHTTIMTIPYVPAGEKIDPVLQEVGQSYWKQNTAFYIKFVPVAANARIPNNALRILEKASVLSHVRGDRPNDLVLASSVIQNKTLLKMTIAHELGHVLGFEDCYVEYFNQVSEELVYYEVDSTNLMCSMQPGNYLPSSYFSKLINERCLF